jgi:hypothetical protein
VRTPALIAGLLLAWLLAPGEALGTGPALTNLSADFHGYSRGVQLRQGDVVEAYDPDGVLCGRFVVKRPGVYGFLHVYGDDPATPQDEGAVAGDVIKFRVNGRVARAAGPEPAVWPGDGEMVRVDIRR